MVSEPHHSVPKVIRSLWEWVDSTRGVDVGWDDPLRQRGLLRDFPSWMGVLEHSWTKHSIPNLLLHPASFDSQYYHCVDVVFQNCAWQQAIDNGYNSEI